MKRIVFLPQHDRGVVASLAVLSTPREALLVEAKVLGEGDDGKGGATVQRVLEAVRHLVGLAPVEPLIVLHVTDIRALW